MDSQPTDVRKSHSNYVNKYPKISHSNEYKSDTNVISDKHSSNLNKEVSFECKKYYKNYAHDEIPVKDDSSFNDHSFSEGHESGRGDNKNSITNIPFDEIEMKILKKMSQELQTDDNSISSLDSNIKLFKTTVNQILDNFYTNMKDFELYKKKFNEILQKNKGDSVAEMEDFIKDIIQHVGSSEASMSNNKFTEVKDFEEKSSKQNNFTTNIDKERVSNSLNSTIEAFKNENYLTDSTFEQDSSKFNTGGRKNEFLNIHLLSGTRYVEIKMNDRSLFSEINIRDCVDGIKEPLASAENIKKLEAKKLELENYIKEHHHIKDREIPVKNSNAKKNIHLNEDFLDNDKDECHKFFIFRICNYICRKIRKNAFG